MRFWEIAYWMLLGTCNLIIFIQLFRLGISNTLLKDVISGITGKVCFFGITITLIGGIAHRILGFNPDIKNPWSWIIVFGIPLCLAIIIRINMPRGWKNIEKGKRIWQKLPLEYNRYGVKNTNAYNFQSSPEIRLAEGLIRSAIKEASTQIDRAIAYQELGLLYRAINKFEEARNEYTESLNILEDLGGLSSDNKRVLSAYRETLFRVAELNRTLGNLEVAEENYCKTLRIDELLGHDDSIGERTTKYLLEKIKGERGHSLNQ